VNAGRTPPHDPAAEQAILGITLSLGRIPDQVTLAPADFYQPRHEMIWAAILHLASHGQPTDVHAVRARLIETGDLKRNGGELYLLECLQAPPGDPLYLQGIIVDRAGLRRIIIASEQAAMAAYAMEASYVEILRRTELAHAHLDNSVTDELDTLQPLDDFLGNELPEPEWVIPGLLASRERLIITGGEGLGKSVMQRQIGLCAAAGVHPFNWKAIPPATVLVIDVENPPHIVKEVLWGIRSTIRGMGHPIDQNRFWIDQRVGGLDLAHPADRLWLQRRALAVNPALLVIGPAYKLSEARDESRDEALARTVTNVLDEIREDIGCAIVLEHHAGNEQHGSSRPVRPIGSSLWRRWPEFGYGIRKADGLASKERRLVEFVAWRGDRTIRGWPSYMETGLPDGLPWMEAVP
jgi:hypothetical protein